MGPHAQSREQRVSHHSADVDFTPKAALDALARARLHGSLRDGCVIVLGGAFIGASAAFGQPQQYALFAFGVAMAAIGIIFLSLRMYRSFRRGVEQ